MSRLTDDDNSRAWATQTYQDSARAALVRALDQAAPTNDVQDEVLAAFAQRAESNAHAAAAAQAQRSGRL